MSQIASLEELLNTGARILPHEAVAIVQQLLATRDAQPEETGGAPADVILHANGLVHCGGGLPSVQALGRLLDAMLPCGDGVRVSGALRLTVARACNCVDAPPFASPSALSSALERFESGRREAVIRELLVRTGLVSADSSPTAETRPDRRNSANTSDLRRELREADERIFELLHHSTSIPDTEASAAAAAPSRGRLAAVAIAAVLGSFAAGYAATELLTGSPPTHSAAPSAPVERMMPDQRATGEPNSSALK